VQHVAPQISDYTHDGPTSTEQQRRSTRSRVTADTVQHRATTEPAADEPAAAPDVLTRSAAAALTAFPLLLRLLFLLPVQARRLNKIVALRQLNFTNVKSRYESSASKLWPLTALFCSYIFLVDFSAKHASRNFNCRSATIKWLHRQVLSSSVADYARDHENKADLKSTERYVLIWNNLFDSFNSRGPLATQDDERLGALTEAVTFFDRWAQQTGACANPK
jgi:hypothetical protein